MPKWGPLPYGAARLAYASGLEFTQGPNAPPYKYQTVFFGATKEYADDEGWTTIRRRSLKKRHSK